MCAGDHHDHAGALSSAPRAADGPATDPISLQPVDEVVVTTLVDNSYDALVGDVGPARRASPMRLPVRSVPAAHYAEGSTAAALRAEHGFSALITVRRGDRAHTLLFDTGVSPDGLAANMEVLGLDAGAITAVVLSHGHFDHSGGIPGLARLCRSGLPMVLHPLVWTARRLALPGQPEWRMPTLSRRGIEAEGFEVVERQWPSLLLDGSLLVTGEVDRTTDFERGMPFHEALGPDGWQPDPLIVDEQAVVVHLRGKGLVVITGCGHAGAVNICRHAMRLTGVPTLTALIGGFHLTGPAFEPIIEPTVDALTGLGPELLVPAHCTGWKAQHRLAAAAPGAFVPNAVGTSFSLAA
ncbi:MAG TPA: MBL fold metallo-hydrolase [Acidimicrobiales bacterium]|nr:MBL fold metallo-hydrolase [Acidimicrobiales bacterium]